MQPELIIMRLHSVLTIGVNTGIKLIFLEIKSYNPCPLLYTIFNLIDSKGYGGYIFLI